MLYAAFCHFEAQQPESHSLPLYGKEQHGHALKSLLLCSMKERKSYMFEMMWRWVNDDRMFLYDSRRQPLTSIEWGEKTNKNGSQWVPSTVCLPMFFKISSLVFNRRKKLIQVWNKWRIRQNCHFWVSYPFKPIRIRTAIIKQHTIASARRETERRSDHEGFHPAMRNSRVCGGEPQPICLSDQNIGEEWSNGKWERERKA